VLSTRRRVIAALAGAGVALIGVGAVIALGDDGPDVDGEFVLDEPGIYSEPIETVNAGGDLLPDLALADAGGEAVALSSFRGAPLVINVWYSACVPCARELRYFAEVDAEVGDRVQFVGVDPVDDPERMVAFAEERGVEYPLLLDSDGEFVTGVDITAFPTTLFVSPEGRIVHQTNAIEADALRSTITELFG
jgi:peroxiredoxin